MRLAIEENSMTAQSGPSKGRLPQSCLLAIRAGEQRPVVEDGAIGAEFRPPSSASPNIRRPCCSRTGRRRTTKPTSTWGWSAAAPSVSLFGDESQGSDRDLDSQFSVILSPDADLSRTTPPGFPSLVKVASTPRFEPAPKQLIYSLIRGKYFLI